MANAINYSSRVSVEMSGHVRPTAPLSWPFSVNTLIPLGFPFGPVRFPWANPLPSEGQSSCFGSSPFWGSVDSDLEVLLDWSWRGFRFCGECGKGRILERLGGFLAGDGFEGSS
ncbi:hypothetical protein MUK42_12270 [Musa troglodytarum]|uniref:Uncharacterized protein n=1 Tax=Musa troglodytarum TaxID=320322 RepID=A0A9E7GQ94_9LILI|nr:hypothetical protein MUK42_12270 [Musa troglodytarum]